MRGKPFIISAAKEKRDQRREAGGADIIPIRPAG
jgi:hypothetical protein